MTYGILFSLLFSYLILNSAKANTSFRQTEKKILDAILGGGGYDSRIRPSGANGTESGMFSHCHCVDDII